MLFEVKVSQLISDKQTVTISCATCYSCGMALGMEKGGIVRNSLFAATIATMLTGSEMKKYDDTGILPPSLREAIYYSVAPRMYTTPNWEKRSLMDQIVEHIREIKFSLKTGQHKMLDIAPGDPDERKIKNRLDAWRMYLRLPQLYDTFSISTYRPSMAKEDKQYYKINNFWEDLMANGFRLNLKLTYLQKFKTKGDTVKFIYNQILDNQQKHKNSDSSIVTFDMSSAIMNRYKLSLGKDERGTYISYYDKWNLEGNSIEGEKGTIGKPFEIYDRIYFNTETFEILE